MKTTLVAISSLALLIACPLPATAPKVLLDEEFTAPLSADWHWGLGTWTSQDGILRGFESGPRRHGPVKLRKLSLTDAAFEFDFRMEGKAAFAGIILFAARNARTSCTSI